MAKEPENTPELNYSFQARRITLVPGAMVLPASLDASSDDITIEINLVSSARAFLPKMGQSSGNS